MYFLCLEICIYRKKALPLPCILFKNAKYAFKLLIIKQIKLLKNI